MASQINLALINFAQAYGSNVGTIIGRAYGEAFADRHYTSISQQSRAATIQPSGDTLWARKTAEILKNERIKVEIHPDFIDTIKVLASHHIDTALFYGNAPDIIPTIFDLAVNANEAPELGHIIGKKRYFSTQGQKDRAPVFKKACNGFPASSVLSIVGSKDNARASVNVGCLTLLTTIHHPLDEELRNLSADLKIPDCNICNNWDELRKRVTSIVVARGNGEAKLAFA
ncbi:MAG TPA: hypothetical protein DCY07_07685 [Rhodospirillaceae bacterium]|nr:hypothetical protein [Rhodospirillaceae bacterium]